MTKVPGSHPSGSEGFGHLRGSVLTGIGPCGGGVASWPPCHQPGRKRTLDPRRHAVCHLSTAARHPGPGRVCSKRPEMPQHQHTGAEPDSSLHTHFSAEKSCSAHCSVTNEMGGRRCSARNTLKVAGLRGSTGHSAPHGHVGWWAGV